MVWKLRVEVPPPPPPFPWELVAAGVGLVALVAVGYVIYETTRK